ncbi:MAG: response regulator [Magnetococcales bacterium]|nr:response regulator [Magnetococcales bacterium]
MSDNEATPAAESKGEGKEERFVLVVMGDDGREKLDQLLNPLNYRVEKVHSVSEAIPLIKGGSSLPDLLCIDIHSKEEIARSEGLISLKDLGVPILFFNQDQDEPELIPFSDRAIGETPVSPVPMWLLPQWIVMTSQFCTGKNLFEAKVQKGRHDLNNIFGAILGNLHMVMDMADKKAPFFRGLKEIKISGERGREIIKTLYPQPQGDDKIEESQNEAATTTQQKATPTYTPAVATTDSSSDNSDKQVLLVDDDITLLKMTCALFSHNKIPVVSENDPYLALDKFKSAPDSYSLLITDLDMDGMNGVELVGNILKISPEIPVILCSGKDESVLKREAQSVGIRHVILKSSPVTDLVKVTKQILNEGGD